MIAALSAEIDEALCQCLGRLVPEAFGSRSAIVAIRRERSPHSSFYGSDIITVRLAAGEEFKVFLKDFSSYQRVKEGMKERRERELLVYRDLLPGANLGTAEYHGSVWDEAQGRFWLLLEFVSGVPVRYSDYQYWVAAAGWLGRKDGHFMPRAGLLDGYGGLLRHDADFFLSIAEQALANAYWVSPDYGKRLAPIVHQYPRAVDRMVSQPRTLVHGTYRPIQIVLDTRLQPPRLCPVDWERAAIGSAFFDLAFLADGFKPPRLDEILETYRSEAMGCGLRVCEAGELKYLVDCNRLHRVMNWLSVCLDRKFPGETIAKLMGMAEQLEGLVL